MTHAERRELIARCVRRRERDAHDAHLRRIFAPKAIAEVSVAAVIVSVLAFACGLGRAR